MMVRGAVLPLVAAGLIACSQTAEKTQDSGQKTLTGADLTARYAEPVTLYWSDSLNVAGTAAYMPDGTVILEFGSNRWQGSWDIEGDSLCTEFPERERICETQVEQANGNIVSYDQDGNPVSTSRLIND